MLKNVYIHLYNIFVSLLLKCGLDWSRRRYFISENKATCSFIATGLIFYDLRQMVKPFMTAFSAKVTFQIVPEV